MPSNKLLSVDDLPDPPKDLLNVDDLPAPPEKPGLLSRINTAFKPIYEPIAQKVADVGLDTLEGATMGGANALSAGLQTGGEVINEAMGSPFGDTSKPGTVLERFQQNRHLLQKTADEAEGRTPYLAPVAHLVGGMTTGGAVLGAAGLEGQGLAGIASDPTKLQALKNLGLRAAAGTVPGYGLGAVGGALGSREGGLATEDERSKLLSDTLHGGNIGALVGGTVSAVAPMISGGISKLTGSAQESIPIKYPLVRQAKVAYKYGEQGINPSSQTETLDTTLDKVGLSELDKTRTTDLVNKIQDADSRLGQRVSDSLTNAVDENGAPKMINIDQNTNQALSQAQALSAKYPQVTENPKAIFDKLTPSEPVLDAQGNQTFGQSGKPNMQLKQNINVTPEEAHDLLGYVDSTIKNLKAATNKDPGDIGLLNSLYNTRKQFSDTLREQVPEYAQAADRFQSFRKLVPETIIAKNVPVEITDQAYGKPTDLELFNPLKQLMQGATREGSATIPTREAFVQTIKGMKTFERDDAARVASGAIKSGEEAFQEPISSIENQIKLHSDDAVTRGAVDSLAPQTGVAKTVMDSLTGAGGTGHTITLKSANLAGRIKAGVTKNPRAQAARAIFDAPHEVVSNLADALSNTPSLAKYGENLSYALKSPDMMRKNQALFTIMQNPATSDLVKKYTSDEPTE